MHELITLGVPFDRNPDGTIYLKKFGGHQAARSLSAKDYTGRALHETLYRRLLAMQQEGKPVQLFAGVSGSCSTSPATPMTTRATATRWCCGRVRRCMIWSWCSSIPPACRRWG